METDMSVETGAGAEGASVIRMGDIFMVDWNPGRGSEQAGERPALIVQNNAFNANGNYPNTIVVTISRSGRDLPTHVKLQQTAENGLWEPLSYVKCEQLLTISKSRLGRKVGKITPEQLADVSRGLKRLLSLA
jgi:mRNA interferase MazF